MGGAVVFAWPTGVQRLMGLGVPYRQCKARFCHSSDGGTLSYLSGSGAGSAQSNHTQTRATPQCARRGSDTVLMEPHCNMQVAGGQGQHTAIKHRQTQHHEGHGSSQQLNF